MDKTQLEICGFLELSLPDTDWIVILAESAGHILSTCVTGQRAVDLLSKAADRVRREYQQDPNQ